MKNLKEKLLKELDCVVPPLSEDVLNAPIIRVENGEKEEKKRSFTWKMALSCSVAVVALCMAILFPVFFGGKNGVAVNSGYALVLEVNPKVAFTVDDKGKVKTVTALNEDADVILSDSKRLSEMVGQTTEKALEKFIDYSSKLGYLDLINPDAVKITLSEKGKIADGIKKSVENYFMQNGIFTLVITESKTLAEISKNLGFGEETNIKILIDKLSKTPVLEYERQVLGKDLQQIQDYYTQNVLLGDMKNYVKAQLSHNTVSENQVLKLNELNIKIATHSDNPLRIFEVSSPESVYSYWAVRALPFSNFTEEFGNLMAEMEEELTIYNSEHSQKINDYLTLKIVLDLQDAFDFDFIKSLLDNFTDSAYLENISLINQILNALSGEDFKDFDKMPENEQDFIDKVSGYSQSVYFAREKENSQIYSQQRKPLTEGEYQQFIDSIIKEYGSLENYWKNLQ